MVRIHEGPPQQRCGGRRFWRRHRFRTPATRHTKTRPCSPRSGIACNSASSPPPPSWSLRSSWPRPQVGTTPISCGWSSPRFWSAALSTILQVRRLGRRRRRAAHVHRRLCYSVLHNGRGGWRSGHPHHPRPRLGGHPTRRLQIAGHSQAFRHANRGRHGDDDLVHHPGVGRLRTAGRRVGGRTCRGPAHRARHPGHRGRPGAPRFGTAAPLGAHDWHRRRLRGCRRLWHLQL